MSALFSLLIACCIVLFSGAQSVAADMATTLERQLSSPEGVASLMPVFRDRQGQFSIPDPTKDPERFLQAQQTLTILIDQAENYALSNLTPSQLQRRMQGKPAHLPEKWKRAEIALRTDGSKVSCADDEPNCAAYGSPSFLNKLEPIEGLESSFYRNVQDDGSVPALVYLQPTAVSSVSRILLAAADTAGVWIPAAYALGPMGGDAFLIVNNCLDLAKSENGVLVPAAMLVAALQWAG